MTFLFNFRPLLDLLDGLSDPTRERWMERFQIMTAEGIGENAALEMIKAWMRGEK
jgi:hypothetical protein